MSANILRQMAGDVARFLPPGHSSGENSIGQFSIPMRTPWSWANWTSGFHVARKRGQLSSTDLVQSRPMNVFIWPTPSSLGGHDHLLDVLDIDTALPADREPAGWDSSPGR